MTALVLTVALLSAVKAVAGICQLPSMISMDKRVSFTPEFIKR
jgi:hypothetical protein